MKLNLLGKKETPEASKKTIHELLEEIQSADLNHTCKNHPDEEVQFYAVTNGKTLCSECLLSGSYHGSEVISLKKAADKIKPNFEELVSEVENKAEQLGVWEDKLASKKKELDNFVIDYQTEITEHFDRLRAAVDKKEKEIKENVEKIKREKQIEVENQYEAVKTSHEGLLNIKETLSAKLENYKDMELCQYYASKAKLIQNFVEEECTSRLKTLWSITQGESLKEQFNLNSYREAINDLVENVNMLRGVEQKNQRFGLIKKEQTVTIQPEQKEKKAENTVFQTLLSKNLSQKEETVVENPPATLSISQKIMNIRETRQNSTQVRSVSPFEALKKELESISPMTVVKEADTPMSGTEETIKRLFEKVESIKSPQHKEVKEFRNDFRSQSISTFNQLDSHKEKDAPKKFWDTYKDIVDDQGRKRTHTLGSTTKLIDFETKRSIPKTFLPDFTSSKKTIETDMFSIRSKKDLFETPLTKGVTSTKNLRTFVQEESTRQPTLTSSWNVQPRTSKQRTEDAPLFEKSFVSSNLTSNLRKLKRQMGLGSDFMA